MIDPMSLHKAMSQSCLREFVQRIDHIIPNNESIFSSQDVPDDDNKQFQQAFLDCGLKCADYSGSQNIVPEELGRIQS